MGISKAGSKSHLSLGASDKMGNFICLIYERDTKAFIPLIKKNGKNHSSRNESHITICMVG